MKILLHTAFITGSSRGFGRAIAVKLAQEGVKKIAIHYLTRKDEAKKPCPMSKMLVRRLCWFRASTADARRAEEIVQKLLQSSAAATFLYRASLLHRTGSTNIATEVPLAKW